ncbi:hypothetical protein NE237_022359 [Protea cynaroides]|uniref:Major facilitator superfamily (MFS) profile domain-containing protein n=1 Tax=Protea cynaroides TaxID=273540 RepID=A0A9Q0K573_9MAGN|nr:hypothetical protein NE237_022359 [Protea cynaroides]
MGEAIVGENAGHGPLEVFQKKGDIGVMSGASIFISEDLHISDVQVEILVGIRNLYSLIGSATAGSTLDWIGHRYTIVFAIVIFFIGSLMMGFAMNYAFLMVRRFVAGVTVGFALMITSVYTAEVSPASCRGFLSSLPEIFINVGILLGYVSNFAFSRLSLYLSWCFMLGQLGDAKQVLKKTSDSEKEAELRLAEIKEAAKIPSECNDEIVLVPKHSHGEGVWRELLVSPTPSVRRVMIAAFGIHLFQQSTGIDAVVLYSPRIFGKAGITSKNQLLGATVAVGLVKTFFILVSASIMDKIGPRPLLLSSVGGMIISLLFLGFGLTMVDTHPNEKLTQGKSLEEIEGLFGGFNWKDTGRGTSVLGEEGITNGDVQLSSSKS